jgi:hypothetical protein
MKVSYNRSRGNKSSESSSKSQSLPYGRVVDVILDAFHPEYNTYGKSLSLYGVFFTTVSTGTIEGEDAPVRFAYCSNSSIRRLPIKNEFIKFESRPSPEGRDGNASSSRLYWTEIHSLWNHPHHNAYPDSIQVGEGDADLGEIFEEQEKLNPLQLFEGDFAIESRYGSSLRFGGTKGKGSKISTDSSNGKPYTIIRNGQHEDTADGDETILERVNEDKSSIYLTSEHKIDLEQARSKHEGLEERPEKADKFEGAQILMNSDRIFFNSKKEGIYLSSEKDLGITAEQVGIDGDKYITLDANKIYLGRIALKKEDEPVLLGQSTIDWLSQLVTNLNTLINTMAKSPPEGPYSGAVSSVAKSVQPQLPTLKNRLDLLKSRKVFVE